MTKCEEFQYTTLQTNRIAIADEWDTNEFRDNFEKSRRVMIRAEYAGCGKSYACKAMEERGYKVLFVCPTNKLA